MPHYNLKNAYKYPKDGETTMPKEINDQRTLTLAEISEFMENAVIRGEQAEERILKAASERVHKEQMQTLETEWADHKDIWEPMLQKGKTPREALDFLKSFA